MKLRPVLAAIILVVLLSATGTANASLIKDNRMCAWGWLADIAPGSFKSC